MMQKGMRYLLVLSLLLTCWSVFGTRAEAADYTQGVELSGSAATVWFKSAVNTSWVDVHYRETAANSKMSECLTMPENPDMSRPSQALPPAT